MKKGIIILLFFLAIFLIILSWDRELFRRELIANIKENRYENIEKTLSARWKTYSLDFYDNEGNTPLYLAISLEYPVYKNVFKIAKFLLQKGANPNLPAKSDVQIDAQKHEGEIYPLMCILNNFNIRGNPHEDIEMINCLLSNGANANAGYSIDNKANLIPLMLACHIGNPEVVKMLLEHNAKPSFVQKYCGIRLSEHNYDAFDNILTTKQVENENDRYEIIRLLIKHGYNLKKQCLRNIEKINLIQKFIALNKEKSPELSSYLREQMKDLNK